MTAANFSLESVKSTVCQYANDALEAGGQLYNQGKVQVGRAYRYLAPKVAEGYHYLATKISEFVRHAFEFISQKYQELKSIVEPKINQSMQFVVRQYEDVKNNLTRLLDGRSMQHFNAASSSDKSDIILKTGAVALVGSLFLGTLGAVAAGSIAFANLAK
jgi:hypothetical protein